MSAGKLRGYKGMIYDGGHRWPNAIKAGLVCNDLVCLTDMFATFADIVGEHHNKGGEDSMLPSYRALNSADDSEMAEQRRLLYVGITRAMDQLTLSCVRHRPGRDMAPSRFWEELALERDEQK